MLVCLFISPLLPATQSIHLCTESTSFPPYTYSEIEFLDKPGVLPELINLAADKLGMDIEYSFAPWKRCINRLKSGEVDGIFPIIRTKERIKWGKFPEQPEQRLWPARYTVFVARDSPLQWDGESFRNIRHGVSAPLGYLTSKKLTAMRVSPNMTINLDMGMRMVSRHRLDGFVFEERAGWYHAGKIGLESQLRTLPQAFMSENLNVVFNQKYYQEHKNSLDAFWYELDRFSRNLPPDLIDRYNLKP
ncbi:MAG: hypothetical protein AseanaTS_12940 [Candidatus Pelagadaptatus aseana]